MNAVEATVSLKQDGIESKFVLWNHQDRIENFASFNSFRIESGVELYNAMQKLATALDIEFKDSTEKMIVEKNNIVNDQNIIAQLNENIGAKNAYEKLLMNRKVTLE
jgi:hypothetical protein